MNRGFTYRARVPPSAHGETVLDHHAARFRHSTHEEWRARIDEGRVRVNGRTAACGDVLAGGDRLEYDRAGWQEPAAPTSPLRVLLDDEHVLVVDKPVGLQVNPAGPFLERTLLNLVRGEDPARSKWSPVHRIGRGTSGILVVGKSEMARRRLSAGFRRRKLGKLYLAWASRADLPTSFAVREPIGRVARAPAAAHAVVPEGRASLTLVRVLRRDIARGASLVAAWPVTGRADQIRIHLWWVGAPLVGEPLYGPHRTLLDARPGDVGYHLHSALIRFRHPATGRVVRVRCLPPWSLDRAPVAPVAAPSGSGAS